MPLRLELLDWVFCDRVLEQTMSCSLETTIISQGVLALQAFLSSFPFQGCKYWGGHLTSMDGFMMNDINTRSPLFLYIMLDITRSLFLAMDKGLLSSIIM